MICQHVGSNRERSASDLAIYRSSRKRIGEVKRVDEHYGGGRARDCWFSSIRCDNDFANGSSRFGEIVGGSHGFGSKPCESGRCNECIGQIALIEKSHWLNLRTETKYAFLLG